MFTYKSILSGDIEGNDGANFANYDENSYCVVKGAENATLDGFTITGGNSGKGSSVYEAGGMVNGYSTTIVINCIFKGNMGWNGGAMTNNAAATVINCMFFNNWAGQYGGGICNYGSSASAQITNCTFSKNYAVMDGGGIYVWDCSPFVENCIIWDNNDSEINSDVVATYSDIQGGYTGTGNIDTDPFFADPGYWDTTGCN